jgi:hypothetical protein
MTIETTNAEVDDEQLLTEIDELNRKAQKTEEENSKLAELKKERSSRYQLKIDHITSEKKEAEYKAQQAREEADRIRQENETLRRENEEARKKVRPDVQGDFVDIDGQQYLTDRALRRKIESGELTETEAYELQESRKEAKITSGVSKNVLNALRGETQKTQAQQDMMEVLRENPTFNKSHPEFKADDPLYKETAELFAAGIPIKSALEKAKKIVGTTARVDNSDNLTVQTQKTSSPNNTQRKAEVKLTDFEIDTAKRIWQDKKNPVTGRYYTQNEIIEKAKKAKEARVKS